MVFTNWGSSEDQCSDCDHKIGSHKTSFRWSEKKNCMIVKLKCNSCKCVFKLDKVRDCMMCGKCLKDQHLFCSEKCSNKWDLENKKEEDSK